MCIYMYVYSHCMYVYVYMYVYSHCMYVCMYVYMYVCMYVCILTSLCETRLGRFRWYLFANLNSKFSLGFEKMLLVESLFLTHPSRRQPLKIFFISNDRGRSPFEAFDWLFICVDLSDVRDLRVNVVVEIETP